MNSKFFVPFETAKQLKAKGYPQAWATKYYDTFDGNTSLITDRESASCVVEGNEDSPVFADLSKSYTSAPTYHEVLEWLEKKDILIDCTCGYDYNTKEQWYRCFTIKRGTRMQDWHTSQCPTREEALNAAILKALEMIQP